MSDLKHQTVEELKRRERECEKYISKLKSDLNAREQSLKWIKHYIHEKTPQEMSMGQIERVLGHKVILTDGD